MEKDNKLNMIRNTLFYGLLDYTKSFPDYSIPQKFLLASPKKGEEFLENISDSLVEEKDILIYVHLPFCFSECVFCNAYPHKTNKIIQEKYIESLLKEIEIYSKSNIFNEKKVKCIYFGGGTPTAFSNEDIRNILNKIKLYIDLSEYCNITSEAHPDALTNNSRITELSDIGINRISLGCQTFDSKVLELCKRVTSEFQIKETIKNAKKLGLSTNIDMMIGLPGQTIDGIERDLNILSEIAPDSIEYMRHEIVNPQAIALYKNNPDLLVSDDDLFSMVILTQEWMEKLGYEQNGHFTSDKFFPYRYYWLKEMPFIAFGSRSRSYTKTICYDKHEDLSLYNKLNNKGMPPIARYMVLTKKEQMYRSLFLNIQIKKGLNLKEFTNRFEENALETFSPLIKLLTEYGCVQTDKSSIRLTKYGRYFVEDVCCFIIDNALREDEDYANLIRIPHSSGAPASSLSPRLNL